MEQNDFMLNSMIMNQLGLVEGDRRRVYDTDTGSIISFKGKEIVAPGAQGGKLAIEFDPYNNARLMSRLFGYFVSKIDMEDGGDSCIFYMIQEPNTNKSRLVYKKGEECITTRPYLRESLRYMEAVTILNDCPMDFSYADVPIIQQTVTKYPNKYNKGKR